MDRIDYLSQLPIDIFIQNITYLPFSDVVNICSGNKKLRPILDIILDGKS